MVTEVIFIYKDLNDRKEIEDFESSAPIYITYIDYGSKLCKKKAFELMEEWGARKLPFAILKDKDEVIKCLYTENKNKVINDLKELL